MSRAVEIILNILSIFCACVLIGSAIAPIINSVNHWSSSWNNIIIALYIMFGGIVLFIIEIKPPPVLFELFGFLRFWIGRGMLIIAFSLLGIGYGDYWFYVFQIITFVIAIIFIVFQFIHVHIPPPLMK